MKRTRNRGVVYSGLVGAKMRPPNSKPTLRKRTRKVSVVCRGGPLDAAKLSLSEFDGLTTLPFTLKGEAGHYVGGQWVPA